MSIRKYRALSVLNTTLCNFMKMIESVNESKINSDLLRSNVMIANMFQKISETIKQWFEFAQFSAKPVLIPIKVRQNKSRQYPPSQFK